MKNVEQEQIRILNMIKNRQVPASEGYRLLLKLKNERPRQDGFYCKKLELDLANHPSATSHVLDDEQIMTFDGLIELVYGFLTNEVGCNNFSFKDIITKVPLKARIGENAKKSVVVEYNTDKKQFWLKSADDESSDVYLTGFLSQLEEAKPNYKMLYGQSQEGSTTLETGEIYDMDPKARIGAFYRSVKEFKIMGNTAVFEIIPQSKSNFSLNIAVLNTLILPAIRFAKVAMKCEDSFYVPYMIGRLDIFDDTLEGNYQGYMEIKHVEEDYLKVNAQIINTHGSVVVNCEDLHIRRITLKNENNETNKKNEKSVQNHEALDNKIAIVGMSGRFPGANSCEEFWNMLAEGRSGIEEVPKERWDIDMYYDGNPNEFRKTYCRRGGFLTDVDKFDARFFNMSDKEAELTDPQQRVFLEECWNALEDAGYATPALSEANCGVFVGVGQSDYQDIMKSEDIAVGPQSFWGNDSSVLTARIAYYLNLKGPSIAINTACSSSLVSIHYACKSILAGECDMALAGGVFVGTTPNFFIVSSNASMLSADGNCYAFDHKANGFVPGEGVGVLVLKPLKQALSDKDQIHGIISASGVNQDGKTNGITAPSSLAQSELEQRVYSQANINPETINYVEAHGTGTPLGDPVEFEALCRTFRKYTQKEQFCALGSVKVNIGHAATAAGVASAIKAVLCLKNRMIPPHVNFEQENSNIRLQGSPFYINTTLKDCSGNGETPLRAAVSSFGFSGTNCHILIEEAPACEEKRISSQEPFLIPFSAHTVKALGELLERMIGQFEKLNDFCFKDIAYTLGARRKHFNFRKSFLASSLNDLILQMKEALAQETLARAVTGSQRDKDRVNNELKQLLAQASGYKRKNTQQYKEILKELSALYQAGCTFDWNKLYEDEEVTCISLPTIPFQRRSYWLELPEPKIKKPQIPTAVEPSGEDLDTVYFEKQWVPDKQMGNAVYNQIPLLMITDDQGFSSSYENSQIVRITEEDLSRSFESLNKKIDTFIKGNVEIENNLNICVKLCNSQNTGYESENGYSEALTRSFFLMFNIAKSMLKYRGLKVQLIYLSDINSICINPFNTALEGLAKAVKLENPKFSFRVVEKYEDVLLLNQEILNIEYSDLMGAGVCTGIRYKGTERLVPELREINITEYSTAPSILKSKGLYLITGGTKGIGYILAQYLAREYKAGLILVGRSPLDDAISGRIDELRKYGSYVRYYQADVFNATDIKAVAKLLEKNNETINGIFHCAGIIKDSLMKDKTVAQIESVLAPKIQGTMNLLRIFKAKTSDFIMLFSSTASLFGSIGQTDYAYANSFLDNLSQDLPSEAPRVLSINWFYWQNGGMQPNRDILAYMQKDYGLYPVSDKKGIEIIENCLKLNRSNILAVYGNKKKICGAIAPYTTGHTVTPKKETTSSEKLNSRSEDINNLCEQFLKTIISKETNIPVGELDSDFGFDMLGMDSLMITNMNLALDKYFSGVPKTVFFEFTTIRELAGYLSENYSDSCSKLFETQANETEVETQPDEVGVETQALVIEEEEAADTCKGGKTSKKDPAIIGISGVFPKAADMEEFWGNLKQGVDCVGEIPSDRWDNSQYYSESGAVDGKAYCKWGGFISDQDCFDPLFFNLSPKEAEWMDPQERLFIQEVWHTLENAGYTRASLKGKRVGVFAGITNGQYQLLRTNINGTTVSPFNAYASVANRISYIFNFNGPSMAIDTMCSSFITALHYASESVRNGECDLAIAGGVNLIVHPDKYIHLSMCKFASPKGRCHSFGKDADGYVPGEGVGAVLLKPLGKAEEDADYIYGVIKATSINHGGRTNGYTVPNPRAQAGVILDTLNKACINPESITYIETHGTGTSLGDPIEIQGLSQVFEKYTNKKQFCSIGSVKSNIGHLESAAAFAGLAKVLLQFKYKTLVPTLHVEATNPAIDFSKTPFYVQKNISPWNPAEMLGEGGQHVDVPRMAGISSFGAGGANGHVIVTEYANRHMNFSHTDAAASNLFVFSGKDSGSLKRTVEKFYSFLKSINISDGKNTEQIKEDVFRIISEVFDIPVELLSEEQYLTDCGINYFNYYRLCNSMKNLGYDLKENELNLENVTIRDLLQMINAAGGFESKETDGMYSLDNIAYTLQIGREPLKERLGIIAYSKENLLSKLEQWLNNQVAQDIFTS
ncbi:MAG TPA: SDR family NAD(P)-dependent oxidoreductase, partial [Ruminiclostridium sp.]|nr:SDR family NAD(P)-dependent oxidoreductase [Ruminiclostridium sp.]